jgi:hypothetical protein
MSLIFIQGRPDYRGLPPQHPYWRVGADGQRYKEMRRWRYFHIPF